MKFKFFVLVLTLLLISGPAFGQTVRGRVEGTVKDPQGQMVPNAAITVTNIGTGEKLNATSTDEGTFSINEVKPGTYTVTAEIQGFKKVLIEGMIVQVGTVTSVTVRVSPGSKRTAVPAGMSRCRFEASARSKSSAEFVFSKG